VTTVTRVMFAIPSLDRDGPDRVMFELMCGLDRSKFAPSLLVSEPTGHYLERLPKDVVVEVLGTQRSFATRYPIVKALRAVRAKAPDVVFATLRMNLTLAMASPGFPRKTRLVLRQANDFTTNYADLVARSPIKHRVSKVVSLAMLKRADAVICQSTAMRDDLAKLLGDARKLHVIGNPIDIDAVTRGAQAATVTLPGKPALVAVGRMMAQKGFDLLLPAIALIRGRHPDLHLTIFGDGPDRGALEAQRAKLGLEDIVTFAGFTKQVLPNVRAADRFVLSSRYEGFPNAALEALACGTPVVLTDCPGANREIVLPGVNGRLAASLQATDIAGAIEASIADTYDRDAIVADTRARFAARRIIEHYERVLAG